MPLELYLFGQTQLLCVLHFSQGWREAERGVETEAANTTDFSSHRFG